jgi:hypothetical protein
MYQNLNQNYNILYSEHLILSLYVCTCIFLLRQESFDMILVNNPSFYDGGFTTAVLNFICVVGDSMMIYFSRKRCLSISTTHTI